MVVFDSSVLLLVLNPKARPPIDPATGEPLEKAAEHVELLIENLARGKDKIIIPTPVLSEILVHAGDATSEYLNILNKESVFRVAPFDQKAAIEAAFSMRDALSRGGKRVDSSNPQVTNAKIKFDRQIVAIAKAEEAHSVYSDDDDVHNYAKHAKLQAYRTSDLELPPEALQGELDL